MSAPKFTTPGSAAFRQIAEEYFGALADGNLARVPWADDVVLRAPLAAQNPLQGRQAVEDYLRPLAGQLGEIQIREIFVSSARDAMAVEAIVGPLHVLDKFVIRDGQIIEQQNFYDPRPVLDAAVPGGLTADERSLLIERLESSRERVRELLAATPDEVLRRRSAEGGWTALECAEHLTTTEEVVLRMIRRDMLNRPPDPSLPLQLQDRDSMIIAAMNDRSMKVKALDILEPRGAYSTGPSVLDAFLARRADTIDFVRRTRDPLHHHAAELPGVGLLDAYHWLLLITAHTDRHLHQMREQL
jgi:hypothetical protein